MTTKIVKKEPATLKEFIHGFEYEFNLVKTDNQIHFEKEAQFAMQILSEKEFLLGIAKSNGASIRNAVINIAATGLTLNPVSQLAYLIPRKINKQWAICLDISYKGLIRTATDSGSILWAQAEIVYEKDKFRLTSIGEKPIHEHDPFSKERGKEVGAYVVVKTFEGDYLTTVMNIEEIYEIRAKSEAYKKGSGPWISFRGEMIKKTVVKRAAKMWPRTNKIDRLEKAIDVVNEHEGIDFKKEESLQDQAEKDFPRSEEDKAHGNNYLILRGKFKDKRLQDLSLDAVVSYINHLEKKIEKGDQLYTSNNWIEILEAFKDFSANYETYQDILNEEE